MSANCFLLDMSNDVTQRNGIFWVFLWQEFLVTTIYIQKFKSGLEVKR